MKHRARAIYNELVTALCIAILVSIVAGIAFLIVSPGW